MQGGKNRILPKQINANRFFWDSHWLEIRSNHFCPSMGPNGGSVATDSVRNYTSLNPLTFLGKASEFSATYLKSSDKISPKICA